MNSSRGVQTARIPCCRCNDWRLEATEASIKSPHKKNGSLLDGGTLLGNGANVKHTQSTFGKAKKHQLQIWENGSSRYWWNWVF